MNIFKSVIGKLLLLVTVPLLALALSCVIGARTEWLRYEGAHETEKMMQLAAALGDVIHKLQVERGTSSEELAATAEEMSSQAEQLQQTMAFFKI